MRGGCQPKVGIAIRGRGRRGIAGWIGGFFWFVDLWAFTERGAAWSAIYGDGLYVCSSSLQMRRFLVDEKMLSLNYIMSSFKMIKLS